VARIRRIVHSPVICSNVKWSRCQMKIGGSQYRSSSAPSFCIRRGRDSRADPLFFPRRSVSGTFALEMPLVLISISSLFHHPRVYEHLWGVVFCPSSLIPSFTSFHHAARLRFRPQGCPPQQQNQRWLPGPAEIRAQGTPASRESKEHGDRGQRILIS